MVDVTHHGDHGWTSDQVSLVGLLDHFDGLLRRFLHVVLEDGHPELVGHRFDRVHVQGLGDRGDDPFEEQGFDDFGALDTQHVGQLLHREVVLRHNDHLGPDLLGFAGRPQLHRPTTLTLTGGLLAPFAHRGHRFGRRALLGFGLGRTSEARRQDHVFLFACKTTGLGGQGIIVFTDDVHLLALALRRTAAQGLQFGAVIPVGTTGTALTTGTTGTEARAPWRRRCIRSCHRRCCRCGSLAGFGRRFRSAWGRCHRPTHGLLQLHELAGSHWLAHAAGHARPRGSTGASRCSRASTTCCAAVSANGLAHQLKGVAAFADRCAWPCRSSGTARTLGNTCTGAPGNRLANEFGTRRWPRGGTGFGRSASTDRCTGARGASGGSGRSIGTSHDLRLLTLTRGRTAWCGTRSRHRLGCRRPRGGWLGRGPWRWSRRCWFRRCWFCGRCGLTDQLRLAGLGFHRCSRLGWCWARDRL